MRFIAFCIIVASAVFITVDVTKMAVCDVKNALEKANAQGNISDWMCIIYEDTQYSYDAVNNYTPVGLRYGLFQIQEPIWCATDSVYDTDETFINRCDIDCNMLTNSDISDDIDCSQQMYLEFGFDYWSIWVEKCRYQNLNRDEYGYSCEKNTY